MSKYGHRPINWFESIVNKMGGEEKAEEYLRGELGLVAMDPFHETGELIIQIPALRRPTLAELKAKYSWVCQIERDVSPEGPVTLRLGTLLRKGEDQIKGQEFERRSKTIAGQTLGFQHAEWLVGCQNSFPALTALLERVCIDFLGIVVVNADGGQIFPYLVRNDERCCLCWIWWLGLTRSGRLAVSK